MSPRLRSLARTALLALTLCAAVVVAAPQPRTEHFPSADGRSSADEEVSPTGCAEVLARASGRPVWVTTYPGATHDFDDPGKARQSDAANRDAKADAMARAATLLDGVAP